MNDKIMHSLEKSINLLKDEINCINNDNEIKDKFELFKKIGDCINWIYMAIERINSEHLSMGDKKIISAFRGAANVQKHFQNFNGFEKFINCSRFPFSLPAILGDKPSIKWQELDLNVINNKSQIKIFNEILANKEIIDTIYNVYEIINKYEGEDSNE